MQNLSIALPESILAALQARASDEESTVDNLIAAAVGQYLGQAIHTLFQVSTSAALVEGLYQGAVRVSLLKQHGDFGLGTFIALDGEMIVLEGSVYRVDASGAVSEAADDLLIPYAVVTTFREEHIQLGFHFANFAELEKACDSLRTSQNLFYAFRLDGEFKSVQTRVMHAVARGTGLSAAASAQENFSFENIQGTLVGLWAPGYASSFSVPGYHFHFISEDRSCGGHVLDCQAAAITAKACSITQLQVALPETEQFLRADLSRDPNSDLRSAERSHGK